MSGLYEELCNLFIKPARQSYSDHDLGPLVVGHSGTRYNFTFASHKGFDIKASLFKNNNKFSQVCVIYLHSFNGSRLQSLRYVSNILEKGFHFCSFDFAGCGNSGGEYVTLGCNQRWDVLKLIQNLQNKYGFTQYFIWGRSMGAVTAIKFYSLLVQEQKRGLWSNISILGLILDSAFISLRRMVAEVGSQKSSMPQFLIKAVFLMVSSSIQQRAGFNIDELDLQAEIECIRCSTLLIASNEDTFVAHAHTEEIFSKLKLHHKEILYTKGEHYEQRDRTTLNEIYMFLEKNLKKNVNAPYSIKQHSNQQQSIQKSNRSLKKYEPKNLQLSKINNHGFAYQSQKQDCAKIYFRSVKNDKTPQFRTEKKIQIKQTQHCERQYQTQKRISDFRPQIKFVTTTQVRNNDEIKNSNKPNITKSKKQQHIQDSQNIERLQPQKNVELIHDKSSNQESHCNIIADRLRKQGKYHKHKNVQFKNIPNNEANSIQIQTQQRPSARAKILFHICNPADPSTPMSLDKQAKRFSMTAQQYKNIQIKKGFIGLSPRNRQRQETANLSELKIRPDNIRENQAKSMKNLFALKDTQKDQGHNAARIKMNQNSITCNINAKYN